METKYKCPDCGSDKIRAGAEGTCRVGFDSNGKITTCDDFLDYETDEDTLYCEGCGEHLQMTEDRQELEMKQWPHENRLLDLLRAATHLLDRDNRPEVESWLEEVEKTTGIQSDE